MPQSANSRLGRAAVRGHPTVLLLGCKKCWLRDGRDGRYAAVMLPMDRQNLIIAHPGDKMKVHARVTTRDTDEGGPGSSGEKGPELRYDQVAFRHDNGLTTYAHAGQGSAARFDVDVENARPAHLDPLLHPPARTSILK